MKNMFKVLLGVVACCLVVGQAEAVRFRVVSPARCSFSDKFINTNANSFGYNCRNSQVFLVSDVTNNTNPSNPVPAKLIYRVISGVATPLGANVPIRSIVIGIVPLDKVDSCTGTLWNWSASDPLSYTTSLTVDGQATQLTFQRVDLFKLSEASVPNATSTYICLSQANGNWGFGADTDRNLCLFEKRINPTNSNQFALIDTSRATSATAGIYSLTLGSNGGLQFSSGINYVWTKTTATTGAVSYTSTITTSNGQSVAKTLTAVAVD